MSDFLKTMAERGFLKQNSDPDGITALFGKERVNAYIGFDPTASSLHVGSLLPIMGLAHLQRAGHRPIAIVGGGTALVGDPSGKSELRQMLTLEKIQENMLGLQSQLSRFLTFSDSEAVLLNNADWLCKWNYVDFLREIGRHFSVNHMLGQESVKMRLEKGLSFIEFNYSILQAYDFMHLNREFDCKLQMGGDDQWGNIVAGIDLTRRMNQVQTYGLTYPLITTASGAKMGKTAQGAVWLDRERTTPYEFYQFWINVDDADVQRFLGLFTFVPMDEVNRLGALEGAEINEAKRILAYEVTKLVHSQADADQAVAATQAAFSGQGDSSNMPSVSIAKSEYADGINVVELFAKAGLADSKGKARKLVEQGGAKLDDKKADGIAQMIPAQGELILKAGKKRFCRVVFE
jgi:tyrosyl-tRNA synthetase